MEKSQLDAYIEMVTTVDNALNDKDSKILFQRKREILDIFYFYHDSKREMIPADHGMVRSRIVPVMIEAEERKLKNFNRNEVNACFDVNILLQALELTSESDVNYD